MLKDEYNVHFIHLIPHSPFTNALDLGVWMALQSQVESRNFMKRTNVAALVRTVYDVWNEVDMDEIIGKVFKRIGKVLALINEGEGGNDLVESKRGIKHEGLNFDYDLNAKNLHDHVESNEYYVEDDDEDLTSMDI